MSLNNNAVCRREDLNVEPHGTNLYRNKSLEHHKYFAARLLTIVIAHEMTQNNLTQSQVTYVSRHRQLRNTIFSSGKENKTEESEKQEKLDFFFAAEATKLPLYPLPMTDIVLLQ